MKAKRNLTNEIVTKKFLNQFDLVNHAIAVAAHIIHAGRQSKPGDWTENPALLALHDIEVGRDIVDSTSEEESKPIVHEMETPKKREKKAEAALRE